MWKRLLCWLAKKTPWFLKDPLSTIASGEDNPWFNNFVPVEKASESYGTVKQRAIEQFNHIWDVTKSVEQKANWMFIASGAVSAWITTHRSEFIGDCWFAGMMILPVLSVMFAGLAFIPRNASFDNYPRNYLQDLLPEWPEADVNAYISASLHEAMVGRVAILAYKSRAIRWSMAFLAAGALLVIVRLGAAS